MSADLREIVRRVGGDLYDNGTRALVPGPGHSRRDRSLSLRVAPGGRVVFNSFAQDPTRDVIAYLGLNQTARPMTDFERRRAVREHDEAQRRRQETVRAFCAAVWDEVQPTEGSPVELYLRGRGISPPIPPAIRFHPRAPLDYAKRDFAPCMVAIVRDAAGSATGLHLTAIQADGSGKALGDKSRRMFGSVAGGAVRLAPYGGSVLAVAEGIETALSFAQIRGVPTWAALSTSGLTKFEPPCGLERLYVAADADANGAGLAAARALAERARNACEVIVSAPKSGDWNDLLRGGGQ